MAMVWRFSNGYSTSEFSTPLNLDKDVVLGEEERDLFLIVDATSASKTVTLGLADGQPMFVLNVGSTNAFGIKNIGEDNATSIATGAVAFIIGSSTANGTNVITLVDGGGEGDNKVGTAKVGEAEVG